MSRHTPSCPWQKIIRTEKIVGNYSDGTPDISIHTTVSFGECLTDCPFYDVIGNYCRRINKHD